MKLVFDFMFVRMRAAARSYWVRGWGVVVLAGGEEEGGGGGGVLGLGMVWIVDCFVCCCLVDGFVSCMVQRGRNLRKMGRRRRKIYQHPIRQKCHLPFLLLFTKTTTRSFSRP